MRGLIFVRNVSRFLFNCDDNWTTIIVWMLGGFGLSSLLSSNIQARYKNPPFPRNGWHSHQIWIRAKQFCFHGHNSCGWRDFVQPWFRSAVIICNEKYFDWKPFPKKSGFPPQFCHRNKRYISQRKPAPPRRLAPTVISKTNRKLSSNPPFLVPTLDLDLA